MKIIVKPYYYEYQATTEDDKSMWTTGKTPGGAVLNLIEEYGNELGIKVKVTL